MLNLEYGSIETTATITHRGSTMRKQFIEMKDSTYSPKDLKKAHEIAPWAVKIAKVEGGYIAFESIIDYDTWRKQK